MVERSGSISLYDATEKTIHISTLIHATTLIVLIEYDTGCTIHIRKATVVYHASFLRYQQIVYRVTTL